MVAEVNSDDGLTWAEYKAIFAKIAKKHNYSITKAIWTRLKKSFDIIDKDNSGSISPSELKAYL